jgi:hypothetical protein
VDPVQRGAVRKAGDGGQNGLKFRFGDPPGHGRGTGANSSLRATLSA